MVNFKVETSFKQFSFHIPQSFDLKIRNIDQIISLMNHDRKIHIESLVHYIAVPWVSSVS